MIFVFLAASLASSAITEVMAGLFALRSQFLFPPHKHCKGILIGGL